MIILGLSSFLLILLGDVNDAYIKSKALKPCVTIGLLMLLVATVCRVDMDGANLIWFAFAAIFFAYLLKSLFGSFPISEAYTDEPDSRRVVDTDLYALCRHPGVLFFMGLYICLHFGINLPWTDTIVYIVLNIIVAALEDRFFFPEFLVGYDKYREKVPFLLPTKESIKNSWNSMGKNGK